MSKKAFLSDWIAAAEGTVPTVPADPLFELPMDAISAFMDRKLEERGYDDVFEEFVTTLDEVPEGRMVRWETCSSGLKTLMNDGVDGSPGGTIELDVGDGTVQWPDSETLTHPSIDDPRFMSILHETPGDSIGLYERPLVNTLVHESHPVEFRAFVNDGMVQGVSAYYPQDELDETYTKLADESGLLAESLIDDVPWDDFSVDFLVVPKNGHNESVITDWDAVHPRYWKDGTLGEKYTLALLEGGPEHRLAGGAHPCCFKMGGIDGIALEKQYEGDPHRPPKADPVKDVFQPDRSSVTP